MSFLAVVHGAQTYNYYNTIPAEMMDRALASSHHWNVAPMVYTAVIAQSIGCLLGVFLLFDTENGCVVTGVFVVALILFLLMSRAQTQSYAALGLTSGIGKNK